MTLKVRDEEDILESNLRYHAAQGVDFFVVTDNGSVDRTPDVLRRYQAAGLLHLIEEPARDFEHRGRRWVTRMARLAATDFGADWVIHADADEFWWPVGGTLKEVFGAVPDAYGMVLAPRPEFVGRPDGSGSFAERLVIREALSRLRPKVAHRARNDISVGRGAHRVRVEQASKARFTRPTGRAVLRAVSAQEDVEQGPLLTAPMWPARILHFPLRSYEQYCKRVEVNLFGGFDETPRRRELRRLYEEGRLADVYAKLILDDAQVEAGLRDRSLVIDTRIRDFLAGCPDPLAQLERPSVHVSDPIDRGGSVRTELDDITLDVMHALARADQLADRRWVKRRHRLRAAKQELSELRERARQLERERDRLDARVAALESRPLARARAAAARVIRGS